MKHAFVADASVAIAWVHPAQATAETNAMLDRLIAGDILVVPALWPLEVSNALTILGRRRKLTAEETHIAVDVMRQLSVTIDHDAASIAFTHLFDLAAEHTLTVYDAVYLELAQRRQLPLATTDTRMRRAAANAGISIWRRT